MFNPCETSFLPWLPITALVLLIPWEEVHVIRAIETVFMIIE
jgi:hypothetical protein